MRDLMTCPSHPSSVDRPSAFGSLGRMQRELDRLFEDTLVEGGLLAWSGEEMTPAIDVSENADAIEVTTDLHGMSADDVEVTLGKRMLTLKGERKGEKEEEEKSATVPSAAMARPCAVWRCRAR